MSKSISSYCKQEELEVYANFLKDNIKRLHIAGERALRLGNTDLYNNIVSWTLVIERIAGELAGIVEECGKGRIMVASQDACNTANFINRIVIGIDRYMPASAGYRDLLVRLLDLVGSLCKGG